MNDNSVSTIILRFRDLVTDRGQTVERNIGLIWSFTDICTSHFAPGSAARPMLMNLVTLKTGTISL